MVAWVNRTMMETSGQCLVMSPSWHWGYPQPQDPEGYLRATYDLTEYCPCGIGARQIAPFRIKRAPTWGRRSILQLNWVFDEFFVKPETWEAVFRPFGIGQREVVLHAGGTAVDNVVQLAITCEVDADVSGIPSKPCPYGRCEARKYFVGCGERMPGPAQVEAPIMRSRQYFGDAAFHLVYVSMELYSRIHAAQLKGAEFDLPRTGLKRG
jgi:hypothetical protein